MPNKEYIVIPEVSSERRHYILIGFMQPDTLCSNLVKIVTDGGRYHFGVLSSLMHNSWMRTVAERLESRYRYSAKLVYNHYPWPDLAEKQYLAIENAAQKVLDARMAYPDATLVDLYDPMTMPPPLVKAHHALDRSVDIAYGKRKYKSEADRVAYLLDRYRSLVENH